MSNDNEILDLLDDSEEESIATKTEKKKKEDKSINDLAVGIRNGGWLRSDIVDVLMQNHWNPKSKGKDIKEFILFDSCILLSKSLTDQHQFLSLAKQFKKFALIKFRVFAMVLFKNSHFSLLLLCNSEIGTYSRDTFYLAIDPLHLHNQLELQKFITRVMKYASVLQRNQISAKEKKRHCDALQFWGDPYVRDKDFQFSTKKISYPPQLDGSACGCFPIVYADTVLSMNDPTSMDEWKQLDVMNLLPSQDMIKDLRMTLHKEYLSLMSKGSTETVVNRDKALRKYLKENRVVVGKIVGDGNCFLTSILKSADFEVRKNDKDINYTEKLAALEQLTSNSLRQELTDFLKSQLSSQYNVDPLDVLLSNSYWIPNLCIPLVAAILATRYHIVLAIVTSSFNEEVPYRVALIPEIWIMVEGEPGPTIVPILFTGSDQKESGHYSAPVNVIDAVPNSLRLEEGMTYICGTIQQREQAMTDFSMTVVQLIIQQGEDTWHFDTFPKITRRPRVITKALELIDMAKSSGTDRLSFLAEVRANSLDGAVVVPLTNAEEVFRKRLNDKTGYKYKSIFPVPHKPIVGTHVDENGMTDLTVTKFFLENGVECVVRFNEQQSNPLEFLAMAMSNQILQTISEYDKFARDVLYTCDILADSSLVVIRQIIADMAKEVELADRKFYSKWFSIVHHMITILQAISLEVEAKHSLKDSDINLLALVKLSFTEEQLLQLHRKFEATEPQEVEYLQSLKKYKKSGFKGILLQEPSKNKPHKVEDVQTAEEDVAKVDEDDAKATTEEEKAALVGSKRSRRATDLYSPTKAKNVEEGVLVIKKKKRNKTSKISASHVHYDEEELKFIFPKDGASSGGAVTQLSNEVDKAFTEAIANITRPEEAKVIKDFYDLYFNKIFAPRRRFDGVAITNIAGLIVKPSSYKREGYKLNDGLFLQPLAVGRQVVARSEDIIARFKEGSYMTIMAYDDLLERGEVIDGYAIYISGGCMIMDCSKNKDECLASKANSCAGIGEPNCRICSDMVEGRWVAWLEAITDILNKDELIYHYGWDPACRSFSDVRRAPTSPKQKKKKKTVLPDFAGEPAEEVISTVAAVLPDCAGEAAEVVIAAAETVLPDCAGKAAEVVIASVAATSSWGGDEGFRLNMPATSADIDLDHPEDMNVGQLKELPNKRNKR